MEALRRELTSVISSVKADSASASASVRGGCTVGSAANNVYGLGRFEAGYVSLKGWVTDWDNRENQSMYTEDLHKIVEEEVLAHMEPEDRSYVDMER